MMFAGNHNARHVRLAAAVALQEYGGATHVGAAEKAYADPDLCENLGLGTAAGFATEIHTDACMQ